MSLLILKDIENEENRIAKQCEFHVGDIVIQTRKSCLIPQGTTCVIVDINLSCDFPYKIRPVDPIFPAALWWPKEDIKETKYAFNF